MGILQKLMMKEDIVREQVSISKSTNSTMEGYQLPGNDGESDGLWGYFLGGKLPLLVSPKLSLLLYLHNLIKKF